MFLIFNFRCLISSVVSKHSLYDFYPSRVLLFGDFFLIAGVQALVNVNGACKASGVWGSMSSEGLSVPGGLFFSFFLLVLIVTAVSYYQVDFPAQFPVLMLLLAQPHALPLFWDSLFYLLGTSFYKIVILRYLIVLPFMWSSYFW